MSAARDTRPGFRVAAEACATCIYRKDSTLDLEKLEDDVRDPHWGLRAIGFAIIRKRAPPYAVGDSGIDTKTSFRPGKSPNG